MSEVLRIVFESFWTFLGTCLILGGFGTFVVKMGALFVLWRVGIKSDRGAREVIQSLAASDDE